MVCLKHLRLFCATKAAMKGVSVQDLESAGVSIILSNTYHLLLQPGGDVVEKQGGLHRFMGWKGPMLTDSGGFQVFSLGHGQVADEIKGRGQKRESKLRNITEEGAQFRSYIDGRLHTLTPEESMCLQQQLGADLIVAFDECTPYHVDKTYTEKSMHLSARWGKGCLAYLEANTQGKQALYSVVQGGVYQDLRVMSADYSNQENFFGQAVGGSLGAEPSQMYDVVNHVMTRLNPKRPTHLLGIGRLPDIWHNVQAGIDTFDCVHPTRMARHGGFLTRESFEFHDEEKRFNIKNARFKNDDNPLDPDCDCTTCQRHSRSYLHHLFKAKEMLGPSLLSLHNIRTMVVFMEKIRAEIKAHQL